MEPSSERLISDATKANLYIRTLLKVDRPFLLARIGMTEAYVGMYWMKGWPRARGYPRIMFHRLTNNVGVYPATNHAANSFSATYTQAISAVDVIARWPKEVMGEQWLVNKLCPEAVQIPVASLQAYRFMHAWWSSLAGKRVLVIHPFAESITAQCEKRELIHPSNPMPEVELQTLKAVQSIAGHQPHQSWMESLRVMTEQVDELDFDVALIGCGGYGLPLGEHIKLMGKQAIHIGGGLQLLFGIKGRRWDRKARETNLYNEHWCRPRPNERPQGLSKVEGGCYW